MAKTTYKEKIKLISDQIVAAQKPIRILDAVKLDSSIADFIKTHHYKRLPKIGPEYYKTIDLRFDPKQKIAELKGIIQTIRTLIGLNDDLGQLLSTITQEYIDVIHLLNARGTKSFLKWSQKLYGSPKDTFFDGQMTVLDQGYLLYDILNGLQEKSLGREYPKTIPAETMVKRLNERLSPYFKDNDIHVRLSDGIISDASAGCDVIKINTQSSFSEMDIHILEVHEGWVHLGTTINGRNQYIARWLSKGPPRCTTTQEGLAVLMEIMTFCTYPRRARKINDRVIAINKAEEGASLLDIVEYYRIEGYTEEESIQNALRTFRGGTVEGGAPFTKDISYCKGFIENYNFIRAAIHAGRPEIIPFIFVGKLNVQDVPLLYRKYEEGIISAPTTLPAPFKDLNGMAVWMSFSYFLDLIDMDAVQKHYNALFHKYL